MSDMHQVAEVAGITDAGMVYVDRDAVVYLTRPSLQADLLDVAGVFGVHSRRCNVRRASVDDRYKRGIHSSSTRSRNDLSSEV